MDSKIFIVVGGQFGSEGKGAVAGRIARDLETMGRRVVGIRVGGPNAGHTVYGRCPAGCGEHSQPDGTPGVSGHPWRLRQVPVAAVTAPSSDLIIAQGSEIDLEVLRQEVAQLDSADYRVSSRLIVDASATVIEENHVDQEYSGQLALRLGSTSKGIGAARSARIWRQAKLMGGVDLDSDSELAALEVGNTAHALWMDLRDQGDSAPDLVIEGTQGYGLGLHAGYYPFCTSGDCRAVDFLAQAGVSPWQVAPGAARPVVCFRPYPIRVAGNSGPLHGETSWAKLGLPAELTTVTQKVRRVGQWDSNLARKAMQANGAPAPYVYTALTMMDQRLPSLAGQDQQIGSSKAILNTLDPREQMVLGDYLNDLYASRLAYVGTGPDTAITSQGLYE